MKSFLVLNLVNLVCVFLYLLLLAWTAGRRLVTHLRSWFPTAG